MMEAQLREWLIGVLSRLAPTWAGEITDQMSLGDEGLCLDSINLVDLIGEIERHLDVRIREDQVSPANFGTVGQLLAFLDGPEPDAG